jgi:hypothetical protein
MTKFCNGLASGIAPAFADQHCSFANVSNGNSRGVGGRFMLGWANGGGRRKKEELGSESISLAPACESISEVRHGGLRRMRIHL